MLKKVYFISKIILTGLILISAVQSCAKAYSLEDLKEFVAIQKDNENLTSNFRTNLNLLNNKWNLIDTVISNNNIPSYNNYLIMQSGVYNTWLYIQMWNENYEYTINSDSSMVFRNTAVLEIPIRESDYNITHYSGWYTSGRQDFNGTTGNFMGLISYEPINGNIYNAVLQNLFVTFEFIPSGIQVTFDGINNVNAIKQEYLVLQFSLGNIVDRDLYYNFIISLSTEGTTLDTLNYYTEYNENSNKNYHKGMLSVNLYNNNVYVLLASPRLNYNQKYTLSIDVYTDSQEHETYTYNYVFLPQNATISGGVITNAGSGDFTNQEVAISNEQNSQEVINAITDSSEVDSIVSGNLPTINNSGDVLSFAEEMGYSSIEFPFTTFLMNLVEGLYDSVTAREDINLSANYGTLNFSINSSDFIIPDNALRFVIRNMLIYIYIYGNYKYIHYLFSLLYTAKINDLTSELGTDEFYDKNYM